MAKYILIQVLKQKCNFGTDNNMFFSQIKTVQQNLRLSSGLADCQNLGLLSPNCISVDQFSGLPLIIHIKIP